MEVPNLPGFRSSRPPSALTPNGRAAHKHTLKYVRGTALVVGDGDAGVRRDHRSLLATSQCGTHLSALRSTMFATQHQQQAQSGTLRLGAREQKELARDREQQFRTSNQEIGGHYNADGSILFAADPALTRPRTAPATAIARGAASTAHRGIGAGAAAGLGDDYDAAADGFEADAYDDEPVADGPDTLPRPTSAASPTRSGALSAASATRPATSWSAFRGRDAGRYSLHAQRSDREKLRTAHGEEYQQLFLRTSLPFQTSDRLPTHLKHDFFTHHGQVLRFDGYFQEAVPESRLESARFRYCVIRYYLDDHTLSVSEEKEANSGIAHGTFLTRQRVPVDRKLAAKRAPAEGYLTFRDFVIGRDVVIFGRAFHITDCDAKTRAFLEAQGEVVPPAQPRPDNEYLLMKPREQQQARRMQRGEAVGWGRRLTDMNEYMEAMAGKEVAVTRKRELFLRHNRHVLRFHCVWDDRKSVYGGLNKFVLHYFLEDDTIEVRNVHERNDGMDPSPLLLSRRRLPRDPQAASAAGTSGSAVAAFYGVEDLRVGNVVSVFGRPLLLVNCDGFTKRFLEEECGVTDVRPIEVAQPQPSAPQPPPPEHYGGLVTFGAPEDALASCQGLVPKKPMRNTAKMLTNGRTVLRFTSKLAREGPTDAGRRFLISLYLGDDTVSVFEPPRRNSGVAGGMFLQRGPYTRADGTRYVPADFVAGEAVAVGGFEFVVLAMDKFTEDYLDGKPMGVGAQLGKLLKSLQERARHSKHSSKEMFYRLDRERSGFVVATDLQRFISTTSPQPLSAEEAASLVRAMDRDADGRVSFLEWAQWLTTEPEDWNFSANPHLPTSFYMQRAHKDDKDVGRRRSLLAFANSFRTRRPALGSVFGRYDKAGRGGLNREQFIAALQDPRAFGKQFPSDMLELVVDHFMQDKETITYRDFVGSLWRIDSSSV